MTVLSCNLQTQRTEQDHRYRTRHTLRYKVETDDRSQESLSILTQAVSAGPHPLPFMNSPYTLFGGIDLGTFVRSRVAERESEESSSWIVTVEYAPPEPGEDPQGGDNTPNPLARPVRYSGDTETFTEEAILSAYGATPADPPVAIVNSAGQRPRDPVQRESTRPVLVAKKNYGSLEEFLDLVDRHGLTTNNAEYRGQAAYRWLVRSIRTGDPQLENGIGFYEVTFRLVLRERGQTWDHQLPDKGLLHYRAPGDLTLKMATDAEGVPVPEEVNLNPDGTRAADDSTTALIPYALHGTSDFDDMGGI